MPSSRQTLSGPATLCTEPAGFSLMLIPVTPSIKLSGSEKKREKRGGESGNRKKATKKSNEKGQREKM